jgi:hypothetical protein
MRNRMVREFALRIQGEIALLHLGVRVTGVCAAIVLCAGLSGCADTTRAVTDLISRPENPNYPTLGKVSDLTDVLTPEERQKALQDMQKQEQTHGADAAKAIEKPAQ